MFESFTESARQVVVFAQDEARVLKHNYIGTEHILLGLARENDGVACRILLDQGADSERLRRDVLRKLGTTPPPDYNARIRAAQRRLERSPFRPYPLVGTAVLVLVGLGILIGWAIWA